MNHMEMLQLYMGEQPYRFKSLQKYLLQGREYRVFENETLPCHDDADFLYYIISGRFKLYVNRFTGDEITYCYCSAGAIIQINHFLLNADQWDPPSVVATDNSVVVSFSRQQIYELLRNDQVLFDEYMNNASSYSTMLKQRIVIASELNAGQRLLLWIDKICSLIDPDAQGHYHIPCHLTQRQLADYLFIHVTTCNKLLVALTKANIIKREKKQLHVYNRDLLQTYLSIGWGTL